MKCILCYLLTTILVCYLLTTGNTYAQDDHFYFKFGGSFDDGFSATKTGFLGYQHDFSTVFGYQAEMGAFDDLHEPQGTIGVGAFSLGIHTLGSGGFYGRFYAGLAGITSTDDRLSSPWEFMEDLELGVQGTNNIGIGLNFKHLSNAGIVPPNLGRDFLLLKISLPIGDSSK